MNAAIALVAVSLLLATGADRSPVEFTKDSLEVVKENVSKGDAVLVDVRSQEEWDEGNIEDSIFLPVTSLRKGGDPKEIGEKLSEDKVLYTLCVIGMRAKQAAKVLIKYGYTVRALKPGYDEMITAGFKKAETKKSGDENTRQRNAG